jgi:SdrD B-like protein
MSVWSRLFRNPKPNRKSQPVRRSRLTLESLDERALPSNTYAFLGSASSFGLMAFNGGSLSMVGQSSVIGDVGVGNNVSMTGRNSTITGTLFAANNARLSLANTFSVSGGVVRQDMSAAINDAVAASNALANLAPTQNLNDVKNSLTLNGNGGMNVVRMKSLSYQNDTLTLSGNAMDVFVVNVRGNFTFRSSHIVLQGGVTADHVIFNFTSNNASVLFRNANSDVVGTFLNTRGSVDYQNAAHFQGAIFARTVSMHLNADLDNGGDTGNGGGTGSISGVTYNDSNPNGHFDLGENGLGGVTVTLTGIDDHNNVVSMTMVSDVDGNFSFTNLRAGTYTLTESMPPSGWTLSGSDFGSAGGSASGDTISSIVLVDGVQANSYFFGFVSGGG